MARRAAMAALLAAAMLGSPAHGDPLDEATAAYKAGDYDGAVKLLRPLANAGNRAAQYDLGMLYNEGKGVAQDPVEASKWFRMAAEQGDRDAEHDLGYLYHEGIGVPQDFAEAAKWYRMSADRGNAVAQFRLAMMFGEGEGVPRSYPEAYFWFTLAASGLPASDVENREKAIRNRDALARALPPEQREAVEKLARDWKPKN
jgi:TPR repeat protein